MWYSMHDESYATGHSVSHEISGRVEVGSASSSLGTYTGINEVEKSGTVLVLGATCGSENSCGVFSMTATAEPATFEA